MVGSKIEFDYSAGTVGGQHYLLQPTASSGSSQLPAILDVGKNRDPSYKNSLDD